MLVQVGEACVGKTTLVKNLFAAYCRESDPAIQDGPRTVQEFADSPEASCTDIEVQVQPDECDTVTSFHYCIQVSKVASVSNQSHPKEDPVASSLIGR